MEAEWREWLERLCEACGRASAALRDRDQPHLAPLIVDIDALRQRLQAELADAS